LQIVLTMIFDWNLIVEQKDGTISEMLNQLKFNCTIIS